MIQQVVLEIFNIPIQVELSIGLKEAKRFHYCFGIINCKVKNNYNLTRIKNNIEKCFSKATIEKFDSKPLIEDKYAYVFGEKIRIYKPYGKDLNLSNSYLLINNKKVTLKKLLKQYIETRCDYYEKLMGLTKHKVNIKHLTAVLGNNHVKTKVLNFNEKLVHFSMELIDSVIIHELCHDFEQNHSKKFYNKVNSYCPNYQEKRNKLIYGVIK